MSLRKITWVASEYGVAEFLSTSNDPNVGSPEVEGLSCCCGTIFVTLCGQTLRVHTTLSIQQSTTTRISHNSAARSVVNLRVRARAKRSGEKSFTLFLSIARLSVSGGPRRRRQAIVVVVVVVS